MHQSITDFRVSLFAAVLLSALSPVFARAQDSSVNLRRTVVVEVVEKTKNAVVNISTTKIVSQRVSPFGGDPFWQQFDMGEVMRVPANSLGSGFIVHEDGYVITNNHVIDRARQITVELLDGRKLPAELISSDPEADLAVLRIHGDKPFPTIALGDSSDLMIGEPTIAVGNPFGYSHSVSTGIVSALHRDLQDNGDKPVMQDLIQTDAAINPGNSGGPLLNAYGEVIGINTAIRSDAQNIGFAIPIDRLRDLIPALMNPADVHRVDLPLKLSERRTITEPATVTSTVVAGVKAPRVVESIDGHHVRDIIDAYADLLRVKAGESVKIKFAGGEGESVAATQAPLPDAIVRAKELLGLTIEPLTPMLADRYHLDQEDGLFVSAVDRDSVAADAGIEPGDVIVQLGRFRIGTLSDLASLIDRLPTSGRVRIGVVRGDSLGYGVLVFGGKNQG
jgi:serine protease Do